MHFAAGPVPPVARQKRGLQNDGPYDDSDDADGNEDRTMGIRANFNYLKMTKKS
jgi:hypothetical protein